MTGLPVAALDNPIDLVFLLVLAFLLFGKDLPEVARNLGKGIRDLKASVNFDELTDAIHSVNEVRSVASPATIARATLPGAALVQDAVGAARDAVNPFGAPDLATPGEEQAAVAAPEGGTPDTPPAQEGGSE